MNVLSEYRSLPDTKSRKCRNYDLAHVGGEVEGVDYVLIFRQGKPGLKSYEEDVYAIQEYDMPGPNQNPGIVFLLVKVNPSPDDPDRDAVYECFVPAGGGKGYCTCTGQKCQVVCKHLDALADACNGDH